MNNSSNDFVGVIPLDTCWRSWKWLDDYRLVIEIFAALSEDNFSKSTEKTIKIEEHF